MSKRESYFLVYVSKNIRSERPSTIDFSTWKEQGKESWSLLSSIRVLCLSACVQMIYFEKPTLHLNKFWDGAPVPLGVCKENFIARKTASCLLQACTHASRGVNIQQQFKLLKPKEESLYGSWRNCPLVILTVMRKAIKIAHFHILSDKRIIAIIVQ